MKQLITVLVLMLLFAVTMVTIYTESLTCFPFSTIVHDDNYKTDRYNIIDENCKFIKYPTDTPTKKS